ncbi:hypothetical protein M427DRAFT_36096 [Gonapodya prolifera JEL478]|uniref:Uncharacterized protein n=1 Tax=Gonapodya prolifera (strain JEL478) TaxID=1344416 RepID=A0A139A2Z6_GONPJ|nr:hypothetical protein M427DRAFT_36096 [Gonapodya prolifera JEL478]|eukprot:KXS11186.1 hypothetical protein M427DRAFT_36096 [Gonapodya prolifera JEL478]
MQQSVFGLDAGNLIESKQEDETTPVLGTPITPIPSTYSAASEEIKTTAVGSTVTSERRIPAHLSRQLMDPGRPRATVAPDAAHPDGQPFHPKTKKDL